MTDIVERLRTGRSGFITWEIRPIDLVAATEIERLRDEVRELRGLLVGLGAGVPAAAILRAEDRA